jgi:hypothetical protein
MDDELLKDAYWAIVTECLERFHDYRRSDAIAAAGDLRARIEHPAAEKNPPPGYDSRYFYHAEPFHVACDLAGRKLDVRERWAEYDVITDRHYAAAG